MTSSITAAPDVPQPFKNLIKETKYEELQRFLEADYKNMAPERVAERLEEFRRFTETVPAQQFYIQNPKNCSIFHDNDGIKYIENLATTYGVTIVCKEKPTDDYGILYYETVKQRIKCRVEVHDNINMDFGPLMRQKDHQCLDNTSLLKNILDSATIRSETDTLINKKMKCATKFDNDQVDEDMIDLNIKEDHHSQITSKTKPKRDDSKQSECNEEVQPLAEVVKKPHLFENTNMTKDFIAAKRCENDSSPTGAKVPLSAAATDTPDQHELDIIANRAPPQDHESANQREYYDARDSHPHGDIPGSSLISRASNLDQPPVPPLLSETTSVRVPRYILQVEQADLPSFNCDAVVNTVNDRLEFRAGLSRHIKAQGGHEIQEDCREFLQSRPRGSRALNAGSVHASCGGRLPAWRVYNVVSPLWEQHQDTFRPIIRGCVDTILRLMTRDHVFRIAFPGISTGIGQCPKDATLATMLDSIDSYFRLNTGRARFREIYLVDRNEEVLRAMQDAMVTKFGRQSVIDGATIDRRNHATVSVVVYGRHALGLVDKLRQDTDADRVFLSQDIATHIPATWAPQHLTEAFLKQPLRDNDIEHILVSHLFHAQTENVFRIHEVSMIQNKTLYDRWMLNKYHMQNKRGPNVALSRFLWHGTNKEALNSINANGFNRSYTAQNVGAKYGCGEYYAVDASYSTGTKYARPDNEGKQYIYLCQVLTGIYKKGSRNLRDLPPINPQQPTELCDSCVDNERNPNMFIIFRDGYAYPYYQVVFSRIQQSVCSLQ